MKAKRLLAVIVMAVAILSVGTVASAEDAQSDTAPAAEQAETPTYSYLRGTRYKNLIATRYENLIATMRAPVEEEGGVINIGAAGQWGYQGTIGSYTLNDNSIAAHLTIPGTSIIDRPIWQSSKSSKYYESSSVTWAAATAHLRSGDLSQNTVIYGHNWNNCFVPFKRTGSQLESLMAFSYADFCQQYQYIYLTTNSGVHTYRVFAVCFTKDTNFYIKCNGIDVASIANYAKGMSQFNFGVPVSSGDKILTISTCTRYFSGLGAAQRFIVMAKLVG